MCEFVDSDRRLEREAVVVVGFTDGLRFNVIFVLRKESVVVGTRAYIRLAVDRPQ